MLWRFLHCSIAAGVAFVYGITQDGWKLGVQNARSSFDIDYVLSGLHLSQRDGSRDNK
jgi:hypothetical protein